MYSRQPFVAALLCGFVFGPSMVRGEHDRFRPRFTLEQIVQTRNLGSFSISPDGTRVAYTTDGYRPDFTNPPQRLGEENNIFVVDVRTGEIRKTTSGVMPKTNPRFSPDGAHIAYEADGDIWTVEVATGRTRRMTVSPATDRSPAWSPDGRWLVFISNRSRRYGELGGPTDLWVTSAERLQDRGTRVGLRRLTEDPSAEREPQWSPDGRTIVYSVPADYDPRRKKNPHYYASAIWSVPANGGPPMRITPDDDVENFRPVWSPDASRVAYLSDRSGYVHVWTMNPDGSDPREFDTGPYDSATSFVKPLWSRAGDQIVVSVNRDGRFDLDVLSVARGTVATVAAASESGGGHFHEVGWGPRGELVYSWENAWSPPDLYIRGVDAPHDEARQLTFSSQAAFRPEHFANVERVAFPSSDGLVLGGFLLTPQGLKPRDRLPAIVSIHGGTYGQHYDHWNPFLHYLTQSGYALLMVDQRGSGGYGRAFRESIKGSYEMGVLNDIRAMVAFLKTKPFVDPTRIVSMGKSHGGYRTLFAMVRDPELFIAGIDLFGPTDRRTPYLNQIGRYHIDAAEAEDPDLYRRLSPITMVEELQGPVLIIHSNQDRNVPGAMSYNFVDELERHHKEYEAVYYPGEAHGLADPAHLLDAYRRIEAFLRKHVPR